MIYFAILKVGTELTARVLFSHQTGNLPVIQKPEIAHTSNVRS
jgi:hypothetical protein